MAINKMQYARILEQQLAKGVPLEKAHKTAIGRGQKVAEAVRKVQKPKVKKPKVKLRRKPAGFKPLTQAQKEGWRRRRKHRSKI